MELELKNKQGKIVGKVKASDDIWNEPMNETLLHQVIVSYQNNKRQGNANTMSRSDSSYSTAKIRPQKGSGRARMGSRSSHLIGGSVAHGPHPKSYRQRIPKKVKRASVRMVLSEKLRQGNVIVVDSIKLEDVSTKKVHDLMNRVGGTKKTLVVLEKSELNNKFLKSFKNLGSIGFTTSDLINSYDLMNTNKLLFTEKALNSIEQNWIKPERKTK